MSDGQGNYVVVMASIEGILRPLRGSRAGALTEEGYLQVIARIEAGAAGALDIPTILVNADLSALPASNRGILNGSIQLLENGAGLFRRSEASTAVNMANVVAVNAAQIVTSPGNWSQTNYPATNVIPSISRAAPGVGVRHIITSINYSLACVIASPIIQCRLIGEGGTVVWSAAISGAAGAFESITVTDLNITFGDNINALINMSVAPGVGNQAAVSFTGYTVVA